jgi:hypothetical protein
MWRARKTNSENLSRRKIHFYSNPIELSNSFTFCFCFRLQTSDELESKTFTNPVGVRWWHFGARIRSKTNHLTFDDNSLPRWVETIQRLRSGIKSQLLSVNLRHWMGFASSMMWLMVIMNLERIENWILSELQSVHWVWRGTCVDVAAAVSEVMKWKTWNFSLNRIFYSYLILRSYLIIQLWI